MIKKEYDNNIKEVSIFSYIGNQVNIQFKYREERVLKKMSYSFYFSNIWFIILFCIFLSGITLFFYLIFSLISVIVIGYISNVLVNKKWQKYGEYKIIKYRDYEKEFKIVNEILNR